MKYFDEEDAITEYEKQLQKKDNEIERLKEEYIILQNASDEVEEELQQRIDKAIEYIEKNVGRCYILDNKKELIETDSEELLEILKGVDKEWQ